MKLLVRVRYCHTDIEAPISYSSPILSGAYAVVRRGKWKGQVVAVKTLRKMTKDSDSVSASQFREFRAEANALNGVPRHKNVMAPVALVLNPPSLLFEFVKGMNLFEFIHQLGDRISWSVVFSIARQVASGLRHLHSQEPEPLAHLDLKSPNIILQMDENDDVKVAPNVKIIDFGLSSRVGPRKLRGRRVENPTWLAPEILRYVSFVAHFSSADQLSLFESGTNLMMKKSTFTLLALFCLNWVPKSIFLVISTSCPTLRTPCVLESDLTYPRPFRLCTASLCSDAGMITPEKDPPSLGY